MSTVLGIKANAGEESVVLVADTQFFLYGDYFKIINSKIRMGKSYALAFTGVADKYVEHFFSYIAGRRSFEQFMKYICDGKPQHPIFDLWNLAINNKPSAEEFAKSSFGSFFESKHPTKSKADQYVASLLSLVADINYNPVQTAVERRQFFEFMLLNGAYIRRESEKTDEPEELYNDLTELVIASNKPSIELFLVNSYGSLSKSSDSESVDYVTSGTGSKIVKEYIDSGEYERDSIVKEKINLDAITTSSAVWLAIGALKRALQDAKTGGHIELVVVKPDFIQSFGDKVRKDLSKAEEESYQEIADMFTVKPS